MILEIFGGNELIVMKNGIRLDRCVSLVCTAGCKECLRCIARTLALQTYPGNLTHHSHRLTFVIFFNSASQQERHGKFSMKTNDDFNFTYMSRQKLLPS